MFNFLRKQFKLIETLALGPYESCGSVVLLPQLDFCPASPLPWGTRLLSRGVARSATGAVCPASLLCVERTRMRES